MLMLNVRRVKICFISGYSVQLYHCLIVYMFNYATFIFSLKFLLARQTIKSMWLLALNLQIKKSEKYFPRCFIRSSCQQMNWTQNAHIPNHSSWNHLQDYETYNTPPNMLNSVYSCNTCPHCKIIVVVDGMNW